MLNRPRTVWPDTKSRRYLRRDLNKFCALPCLVLVTLLIPSEAWAHFHKAGAVGAVSWAEGSKLAGFQLSVEHPVAGLQTGRDSNPWKPVLSVFADVGANWGSHAGGERTQATGMMGVRTTWLRGKFQPFVHLAPVAVHTQDSAADYAETASGLDVGAGLSFRLRGEENRVTGGQREAVFLRVQYDVVAVGGPKAPIQRYQRLSVGIELRFPRSH